MNSLEQQKIKFGKDLFVGTTPGKLNEYYDLVSQLGKGGYGKVYKVQNKKTKEIRACKHLSKLDVKDLEKFKREISFLVKTDHPNIIKLYEVFESQRSLYLVMEECKGGELFERIIKHIEAGEMYSEKNAAEIFLQVMSAIEYCHNNGICHRDLKPENLLYLNDGDEENNPIKIIDFGLSREIQINKKLQSKVGTAYYVSPEILEGTYTQLCDIWSAGVILYVLLSGDPPFNGANDGIIYKKISKMKFSFPEKKWNGISKQAKDLIEHMIAPENKRFTASQVLSHEWFNLAKNDKTLTKGISVDSGFFKEYINSTLLNKMVLMFVATRLQENEIEDMRKIFVSFDKDNDGQINYNEMKEGLKKIGNVSEDEIKAIFEGLDTDKNGKVDYTEFVAATFERKKLLTQERLYEAFTAFDKSNTGKINKEQIMKVLKLEPGSPMEKEIDESIAKIDKTGTGTIDLAEFCEAFGIKKSASKSMIIDNP